MDSILHGLHSLFYNSNRIIRLCGDYKLTVNHLHSSHHLPHVHCMMVSFGGGEGISKWDFANAYMQFAFQRLQEINNYYNSLRSQLL